MITRNDLAIELGVEPSVIDDWLLQGCPAEKILAQWIFDIQNVSAWL